MQEAPTRAGNYILHWSKEIKHITELKESFILKVYGVLKSSHTISLEFEGLGTSENVLLLPVPFSNSTNVFVCYLFLLSFYFHFIFPTLIFYVLVPSKQINMIQNKNPN